jgi:hypothetical protein
MAFHCTNSNNTTTKKATSPNLASRASTSSTSHQMDCSPRLWPMVPSIKNTNLRERCCQR